jgi:hypothetical protein
MSFDIRHGLRLLRHYPATSILALVTLALGIGVNTAIFSVIDTVLLRSLPYPEPDRVVMMLGASERRNHRRRRPLTFSIGAAVMSFSSVAAYAPRPFPWLGSARPRQSPRVS